MPTYLVQIIVLGSAFYLILVSDLSLLTSEKINTTELILILSFLVGFSDRFADSLFNTLIERYSNPPHIRGKNIAKSAQVFTMSSSKCNLEKVYKK